jgi:hypothetical protein
LKIRQSIVYSGDEFNLKNENVGFVDYYPDSSDMNIYLTVSGEILHYFNRKFCSWLMDKYSEFSNYSSVSLFLHEREMEQNLKYEIPLLDLRYRETQKVFYYNLTDEVKDYFKERYINDNGEIQWFSFNYYVVNKVHSSVMSVDHCGEEYHLKLSNEITYEEVIAFIEKHDCKLCEYVIGRRIKETE